MASVDNGDCPQSVWLLAIRIIEGHFTFYMAEEKRIPKRASRHSSVLGAEGRRDVEV